VPSTHSYIHRSIRTELRSPLQPSALERYGLIAGAIGFGFFLGAVITIMTKVGM